MPHTPLLQRIADAIFISGQALAQNRRVEDVLSSRNSATSARPSRPLTRRAFLGRTSAGLATAAFAPALLRASPHPRRIRVAVVGAGLAGLTCAYRLKQAGILATVYEANNRLGGRCWTRRGDFVEGQVAEHGGELIDQSHVTIRHFAQELGLNLDNLLRAEQSGTEPCYHFDGQIYRQIEATEDLKGIWQKMHRDLSEAGFPTLYNRSTERGRELDQLSVRDWIEETVPGGMASPLGQLLDVAYNIEYGAETDVQSSLNLLYLLAYAGPGQLRILGHSNEKYHVRGGNDLIVSRLVDALSSQIITGSPLLAIEQTSSGTCRLSFQNGRGVDTQTFDKVVLALPFSILNAAVDLRRAGFQPLKMTAIRELSMGTNSKLNMQFRDRHWRALGCTGETYSDRGYQSSWEVSRGQPGRSGLLVDYTGGIIGASFGTGTPQERAQQFLNQIEPVLPGISGKWNGRATVDFWPADPWTRGSYSYWKVGQYTTFAGVEGEREDNVHFAGEQTSIEAQGYLEGAVESGERAAAEIVDFRF